MAELLTASSLRERWMLIWKTFCIKITQAMLPGGTKRDYPDVVPPHHLLAWVLSMSLQLSVGHFGKCCDQGQGQPPFPQTHTNASSFLYQLNTKIFPPSSRSSKPSSRPPTCPCKAGLWSLPECCNRTHPKAPLPTVRNNTFCLIMQGINYHYSQKSN